MNLKKNGLVLLGAVIGGWLGYLGFLWLVRQGFYALVLPGGALGIGAGLCKNGSKYVAVLCGFLALGLGCFTEWRFAPFITDSSFGYFMAHVHQLRPVTLLMIAVGTLIGFWVPFRHSREAGKT